MSIGSFSIINDDTTIYPHTRIGKYCSIGKRCEIGVSSHPTNWLSSSPVFYDISTHFPDIAGIFNQKEYSPYKVTTIGHDVWIGSMVMIAGGVSIGTGSIISGGAVVTRSIPPYSIVGGVPARLIRTRFDGDVVNRLLASNWWNLDPVAISKLSVCDVDEVLEKLHE